MKVLFLDVDGVLNSHQSATFWHNKRDQNKWENELYSEWQGSLKEYLAFEFDPIALSNLEELLRRVPRLNIVVSSTWRFGEDVASLQKIFQPAKLVSSAIIDVTPHLGHGVARGLEIQKWLDGHPEVQEFVILDDDNDMEHLSHRLILTDAKNGFTYTDMERVVALFSPEKSSDDPQI